MIPASSSALPKDLPPKTNQQPHPALTNATPATTANPTHLGEAEARKEKLDDPPSPAGEPGVKGTTNTAPNPI